MTKPPLIRRLLTVRYPWVAFILTQICPGWGQLYNRDWKWVWISLGTVVALTCITTVYMFDTLKDIAVAIALGLVLDLGLSVQAFLKAKELNRQHPEPASFDPLRAFYWFCGYLAFTFLLFGLPDGYGYIIPTRLRSFQIPSESMVPNLLVGDRLVADGWAYWGKEPKRGDVIVFDYPKDPKTKFVKRLVGLPGDSIEFKAGELWVNGKIVPQQRTDLLQEEAANRNATEYLEDLDGNLHVIFRNNPGWNESMGPIAVPAGKYFMMGDNRDHSSDSRFWGFVSRDQIIGRMAYIYFSWDKDNKEMPLRLDRIGMQVK